MRRILHISDVHFGPPHLPELARALLALVDDRRPDLVVISGDLTQRAKAAQFRQARAFVDQLPVPSIAVPGNHDVPMYRGAFMARLFVPYAAYQRHFARDMEPVFEDDEMLVVGINTAFNWTIRDGRITPRQLERALARLSAAPAGKLKIVVAHHNLIQPPEFGKYRAMPHAAELATAFDRAGVRLVLSGHAHVTYATRARSFFSQLGSDLVILHSGTTTSNRYRSHGPQENTAFWLEADSGEVRKTLLSWQNGGWSEQLVALS